MIFVLGCPLPDLEDKRLEELCAFWEKELAGSLDEIQIQHIKKFARSDAALRARASRLIARLAALAFLPRGARILTKGNGVYLEADPGRGLCFSHSGIAAFCALGIFDNPAIRLGLDAESAQVLGQGNFENSRKLKNWLKMEACLKAFGNAEIGGLSRALEGKFFPQFPVYARYLAVPGHLVCVVANAGLRKGIIFRWLHYSKFI